MPQLNTLQPDLVVHVLGRVLAKARYARRFAVACMFQVLEHLDRLDALFDHLGALTKARAHLFIAVPNDRRITFNELHGSLLDLPPNHVGRWTRDSFEAIARRHGWRLAAHEVEPEGAAAKVVQHAVYRYTRVRQDPRSLAARVERLPRRVRWPFQVVLVGGLALGSLRAIRELIRTPDLGTHKWVHLTRS